MPVIDVEDVLKAHVRARLEELAEDDVTVHFNLAPVTRIEETEESIEVSMVWRLNLYLSRPTSGEGRTAVANLLGAVPYEACYNGDTRPLDLLLDRMWADTAFGWLMADGDLEGHLERVAAEVEG